jgi:transcriptional regulator with XRE-family HTH domain
MAANRTKEPNPTDRHVGGRIRMRRMMLGMSQTNLADAVQITFQQIQKYEKGTNRVSASRIQQFAKILNVPVAYFFESAPAAKVVGVKSSGEGVATPEYIHNFITSRDGLNIIEGFSRIANHKLRRGLVALVQQIAESCN